MKTLIMVVTMLISWSAQSKQLSRSELQSLACKVANQHNIDCELFKAIVTQESNWKLAAINKKSSDYGLTQINKYTIKAYNFDKTRLMNDAEYSLQAGAKVLKYFADRYKRTEPTTWWTRYNCGTRRTKGVACYNYQAKVLKHLSPSHYLLSSQVAQK